MRFSVRHYVAVLTLASLSGGNALAQREAKVEGNLKSLANGETKTGSGPESPGAGLQGTRNELYTIQESDTLELTFTFAPEFNQEVIVQPDGFISKSFHTDVEGDVAIDNNDQSHILYDGLELRHILEGLRIYVWSTSVQDVTIQNCFIRVEAEAAGGPSSAAVYASVRKGTISGLRVLGNHLIPHSDGLEHWGIYFVSGVQDFKISGNTLAPAGEDGITVWHSAFGEISHNQGGGNGENTIDVKDSHDIDIFNNDADLDREYNIVVHSVDAGDSTYNIRVAHNRCSRGGQGGELSAGIALLFVQKSGVEDNLIDFAFGAGVLVKDRSVNAGNWVLHNRLTGNGGGRHLPAIVLQGPSTTQVSSVRVEANQITPP